jgi:PB1 domain-containing protein
MSDGLTRRISFHTRPSWTELATRLQPLCDIPRNRLAVSYVDSDGDEVTLSSEEELRDFYDSNVDNAIQGNQLIRFRVVELGSLRDTDNFMEPISPQPSSTRNTFGRPTPFVFMDHDHLPFGDLFIPSPIEREVDSPHAFVEVVSDDGEKDKEFSETPSPSYKDKGKSRDPRPFVSDDISSSESVIADETPRKPPIHVQVHGLRPMDSGTFGPPPASSTPPRETVTPTPRPVPSSESHEEVQRELPGPFPDPPTPELDAPIDPNVSLSNDLASLLDSLNSMFLEHPEVGQHLRALFRNVGNGFYWNVQRDSMARVAEDIQRVARDAQSAVAAGAQEMGRNIREKAQQEAARRVTESVGNILRAFGASGMEPPASNTNIPGSAQMSSSANVGPPAAAGSVPAWNQFKPFPAPSSGQGADPSFSATHPPEVSYYTASASREARQNTSELKASLEAAKANYKTEKEKYRQEQESRRRERLARESAANR